MVRKQKTCPEEKVGYLEIFHFSRYYCGEVCFPRFVSHVRPVRQVRKLRILARYISRGS